MMLNYRSRHQPNTKVKQFKWLQHHRGNAGRLMQETNKQCNNFSHVMSERTHVPKMCKHHQFLTVALISQQFFHKRDKWSIVRPYLLYAWLSSLTKNPMVFICVSKSPTSVPAVHHVLLTEHSSIATQHNSIGNQIWPKLKEWERENHRSSST